MKLLRVVTLSVVLLLIMSCGTDSPTSVLKVMTFNIRLNLPSDGVNAWPNRKDMATRMIQFYAPDIFGVQEALVGQVNDLEDRLPEYDWIGVGRDDGHEQGEFMAIYYLREKFELLDQATFWLSETPDKPGKGWDAAWIRVVTWGHFKEKATGQTFYHFNTHLDNRGEQARQEGAKLLLTKIQGIAGSEPVFVTGDFNADPESIPYQILTHGVDKSGFKLKDAKHISRLPHHGPDRTFNGFDLESLKTGAGPIDYIFVQNNIEVLKHATLAETIDGFFPSDHMPVLAEIELH